MRELPKHASNMESKNVSKPQSRQSLYVDDSENNDSAALEDPERKWNEPFSFVLGADPQFGMIGTCKLKKPILTWQPEIKLTQETIQKVNAMDPKPKFFVICGDMLDALPFSKQEIPHYTNNDVVVRDQQYADFTTLFREELDPEIKLVFACGNHDIGDSPTPTTLAKYRKEFGPDYFTFWIGGVKFVVLNSQFFYAPEAVPEETQQHERWIDENVADSNAKYIVVFQHIPFFGESPEEETQYCNIPKERRLVLLEKLYNAGVRYIFCGHYHKNAGGMYKDMELVVTGAMGAPFGNDPSGFRVFHVGNFDITHEYVKLRETIDCSEFEVNDGDGRSKEETSSITASERLRRSKWLLWVCCGADSIQEDNLDDLSTASL